MLCFLCVLDGCLCQKLLQFVMFSRGFKMMMFNAAVGLGTRRIWGRVLVGAFTLVVGLSNCSVQADELLPVGDESGVASPQGQSASVSDHQASQPGEAKHSKGNEASAIGRTEQAVRVAALPRQEEKEDRLLFNAPILQPIERLGANDSGVIAIRINQLLSHPVLGTRVSNLVDPMLDSGWKMLVGRGTAPPRAAIGITLENIDHLIGSMFFSFSKKKGEPGSDKNSSFSLGMTAGLAFLDNPVNHDAIRNAINEGPFTALLDHVLVDGAVTKELVLKSSANEGDSSMQACIQRGWQVVDGGMVTASIALPKTLGYIENERDQHIDDIFACAASMAVGVDVQDAGPAEFRVVFVPVEGKTCAELKQALTAGMDLLKSEIASSSGNGQNVPNEAVLVTLQQTLDALQMKSMTSEDLGSRDYVELTFRVPLDVLMLPLQFNTGQGG